ncbi:MAG: DNA polymerase III subunit delta [Bacteroidaceae bacterium]|nr:DNA polymerase III subunit delta [Bacteroidaceae bacterium]
MAAKVAISHRDIVDSIRKNDLAPVYLLMGEETYYIDKISEYMEQNILKPEERDFNQQIIYCTRDTDVVDIVNSAKRYPMMAEHQVVIVKEAQNLLKIDDLVPYINKPLQTTILVICYKHGSIDKRKKIVAAIEKNGVVYESTKVKDSFLPQFITDYLTRKKVAIEQNACQLLVEAIGADLSRMATELDKLIITLGPDNRKITSEHIERNIGISKDFNGFELRKAIMEKDVFKANQIINYLSDNPKVNPPQPTLAMLFNIFSNIMLAYYAPDKSTRGIMEQLDLRAEWQVKQYTDAMKKYSAMKAMLIIGKIRETDVKIKGVEKGNASDAEVMRELIFFILH